MPQTSHLTVKLLSNIRMRTHVFLSGPGSVTNAVVVQGGSMLMAGTNDH